MPSDIPRGNVSGLNLLGLRLSRGTVPANSINTQTFNVVGLRKTDVVQLSAQQPVAGLGIVGCRVSALGKLEVQFVNSTSGAFPDLSGDYTLLVVRPTVDKLETIRPIANPADFAAMAALPQMVGYWDPSVSSKTLPGDASAAIPGNPVGFIPNAANFSALGPNVIVGTPTWADSDPTIASIAQTGGEVTLTSLKASAAAAYASLANSAPPTMIGGTYEFSVEITQLPAGAVVYVGAVDGGWVSSLTMRTAVSAGVFAVRFVATTITSIPVVGLAPSSAGQVLTFKDATCKLVSTKDASQATTANKPILRRTPTTKQLWLDADNADALNIRLAAQLTNAAIFRVTAEGVTVARGQTVATTYNLISPFSYVGPIAIFDESSTALTADQVAQITRYMSASVPALGAEEVPDGAFSSGSTAGWISASGTTISVSNGKLNIAKSVVGDNWGVARLATALRADTPYLFKFDGTAGTFAQGFWRLISETFGDQKGAETFSAGSFSKVAVSYPEGYPSHFDIGVADVVVGSSFNYDNISARAIL